MILRLTLVAILLLSTFNNASAQQYRTAQVPGAVPLGPVFSPQFPQQFPTQFPSVQNPFGMNYGNPYGFAQPNFQNNSQFNVSPDQNLFTSTNPRGTRRISSFFNDSLATDSSKIPTAFSDSIRFGTQIFTQNDVSVDAPIGGGMRRQKYASNNSAFLADRVFFNYQYFHNALVPPFTPTPEVQSVSSFTLGFEKRIFNRVSVDVRIPFLDQGYNYSTNQINGISMPVELVNVTGGDVGNLNVLLKYLLLSRPGTAVSGGLGINIPTGSDVSGLIQETEEFEITNQSVFLAPFVAVSSGVPNGPFFFHSSLQIDIPVNGDELAVTNSFGVPTEHTEETLIYADISIGSWLRRNYTTDGYLYRGLAALFEMHYSTSIEDPEISAVDTFLNGPGQLTLLNLGNRLDILNVVAGLHHQINGNEFRLGMAFPIRDDFDRQFDSEVIFQYNRRL